MARTPLAQAISETARDYYNRSEEDRLRALALEDEARRRQQAISDRSYWDAETRQRNAADADANVTRQLEAEKARLMALPEAQKRGLAASLGVAGADTMPLAELNKLIDTANAEQLRVAARQAAQVELDVGNEFLAPRQALRVAENAPAKDYAEKQTRALMERVEQSRNQMLGLESEMQAQAEQILEQIHAASQYAKMSPAELKAANVPDDIASRVMSDPMLAQQFQLAQRNLQQQYSSRMRAIQEVYQQDSRLLSQAVQSAGQVGAEWWNQTPAAGAAPSVSASQDLSADQIADMAASRPAAVPTPSIEAAAPQGRSWLSRFWSKDDPVPEAVDPNPLPPARPFFGQQRDNSLNRARIADAVTGIGRAVNPSYWNNTPGSERGGGSNVLTYGGTPEYVDSLRRRAAAFDARSPGSAEAEALRRQADQLSQRLNPRPQIVRGPGGYFPEY